MEIELTIWGMFLLRPDQIYYRISGPPDFILRYGILNDSRVRFRNEPNLDSAIIGHLNIKDEVAILDQTIEPMKIGDMESVWYNIRTKTGQVGWVYGHFIDLVP